jgi:ATP-dependent protease Clp ATPase subunit
MYDLPDIKNLNKIIITAGFIEGTDEPIYEYFKETKNIKLTGS